MKTLIQHYTDNTYSEDVSAMSHDQIAMWIHCGQVADCDCEHELIGFTALELASIENYLKIRQDRLIAEFG